MPQAPNQPPSSAVDAELAELFGCDIRDIREDRHLQMSDGHTGNAGQEFFCPIEGCARSRGRGPPWRNRDALRAPIDLHCIGELQAQPSAEWLRQQRLQGCGVCGRTLSIRFASGVHVHCWPRVRTAEGANPPQTAQENLSSLHDIFTTPIFIKDHLPAELWPQIRSEYARLLAGIGSSNRRDAWDAAPAAVDHDIPSENAAKQRARRAWTELLMFPKSICRQNKRRQRRGQPIAFTRSLLARWKMGERQGLWDEAVMAIRKRGRRGPKDNNAEQREADICRLVSLGRPGQAAKRLVSPGLAEANDVNKQKFLAKFPPNPDDIAHGPWRNHPLLNFPWNWYSNPCNLFQ